MVHLHKSEVSESDEADSSELFHAGEKRAFLRERASAGPATSMSEKTGRGINLLHAGEMRAFPRNPDNALGPI